MKRAKPSTAAQAIMVIGNIKNTIAPRGAVNVRSTSSALKSLPCTMQGSIAASLISHPSAAARSAAVIIPDNGASASTIEKAIMNQRKRCSTSPTRNPSKS